MLYLSFGHANMAYMKPSKSKVEPTDAETLRALQFALAPLQLEDRADWTRDGDPIAFAGESEAEYNERTNRYGEDQ